MSWFERFCWIWQFKNNYISRISYSGVPYRLFRVEDLFIARPGIYQELSNFTGIPLHPVDIDSSDSNRNQSISKKITYWQDWPEQDCALLDSWCGDLMHEYGYGGEPDWQDKVEKGRALLGNNS